MRARALLLIALLAALIAPASARAHGGHNSPFETFTQIVGPYDLAVTIEYPPSLPSTLYLIVVPQGPIDGATIRLGAGPRGAPPSVTAPDLQTYAGTRIYYAELPVDRAGDWDLHLEISGPQGAGQARIPFILTPTPIGGQTIPLLATLATLVLLIVVGLGLGRIDRARGGPALALADRIVGYAIFASAVVAAVLGVQQYLAQQAPPPAPSYGRPHVNAALTLDPPAPQAGQPFRLTIDLSDGSTGLPADDIVTHHEALMHLLLVDQDGATFAHVHPARVAPGRYALDMALPRAGPYTAFIEIERLASGTQLIARPLTIAGDPGAAPPPAPGLGPRTVDGYDVTVSSSLSPLVAGRQTTIGVSVSQAGAPVTTIEPWLGMAGHLIARSADGGVVGHIHAAGGMATPATSAAIITPPSYGPELQFVYTFPQPGRYQLWAQFQVAGKVVTVPVTVEVQ